MPSDGPLAPPNVPKPWTVRPLRQATNLIKDGTHGTHKRVESGIPFLSAKNITAQGTVMYDESDSQVAQEDFDAIHKSYRMKSGDILLTVVGSLGRHALLRTNPEFTIQRSVAVIRPSDVMYPAYLDHYFSGKHFQGQLDGRSNSTAQAGVYLGELAKIPVPIPPLPEQKKIAAILSSVDEAIQATQAVIEQTRRVKEGLLQDLLTKGIGPGGVPHTRFKQTEIGEIPESWEVLKLAQASTAMNNGFVGVAAKHYRETGRTYLRGTNIRPNRIDLKDPIFVSEDFYLANPRTHLHPGDVVTVQSGHIGTSAAVPARLMGASCHALIITRPKRSVLDGNFLSFYLNSGVGSRAIERIITGSTVKHINTKDLRRFKVPVPPIREQRQIAERLSSLETNVDEALRLRAQAERTKAGLLQDLLTGKVRVRA